MRTFKEQCVHRQRSESIKHTNRILADWIGFYNHHHPADTKGDKCSEIGLGQYINKF
ncbi:hypothetical protein CEQ07_11365 [Oligella urethralis]|uniref:integrase core domain-containing protein n=1 Tax=Oligella urethralis TaxID=90245 RepID=UPI000CFEDFD2|nr:hypothetical protein CEQ07_11365 [Oligella urethralis]